MEPFPEREIFLQYASEIKGLGYKVYTRENELTTYGWIINDKNEIGYFQLDVFGCGVCFSTVHKPMHDFGTEFGLDDYFEGHLKLTNEIIDRSFIHHPSWARGPIDKIQKYKGDEFIQNEKTIWFHDIIEV